MRLPSRVEVTEVVTRNGFQAEARFVPKAVKIELIDAFIAAGVKRIEATSFVSPKAVPQLADAQQVIAGISRRGKSRLAGLVPNARGACRAIDAGIDEIVVIASASQSHNMSNLNCPIEETVEHLEDVAQIARGGEVYLHGGLAVAFGCPFEGEIPTQQVVDIARRFHRIGIRNLTLGDTTEMASPLVVERTCAAILAQLSEMGLTLHFHNTRGIGLANVLATLQIGINHFEATPGGLGGCPFAPGASGNVCTEDLVYPLHELGIETGIALSTLISIAKRIEAVVGRALQGQVTKVGPRLHLHALAGIRRAIG